MITLIDGLGNMGSKLEERIKDIKIEKDIAIYHKWNPWEKDNKQIQKDCYEEFKKFVDENQEKRIVFISTLSQNNDYYTKYKIKAGWYLLENHSDKKIFFFNTILGKGTCQKLLNGEIQPYGNMHLITMDYAVDFILERMNNDTTISTYYGEKIPASLVTDLMKFGKKEGEKSGKKIGDGNIIKRGIETES